MPFFLFFHTQFVPKNVFNQITGCRKAPILNSNVNPTFLFELLKHLCYQLHFSWKETEKLLLKSVSKLHDLRTQLTLFLTHCNIHFNYYILLSNSDFKLQFSCIPQITSSSALGRFHFSVM